MQRTRSERRAHAERLIKKRLSIIRNAWGYNGNRSYNSEEQFPWAFAKPHRFAKCNLRSCSCPMCKGERYSRKNLQKPTPEEE